MSIYKKGQSSGEGRFNKPVKTTPARGDNPQGVEKGKDISKAVWDSNDSAGIRGGRPDRDETGR
jgi:hypothetical protein